MAVIGVLVAIVLYLHQDTKADVRELRTLLYSVLQSGVKLEVAVKDVVQAAVDEGKLKSFTEVDFAPTPEPETKPYRRFVVISDVWVLVGAAAIWYGWRLFTALF